MSYTPSTDPIELMDFSRLPRTQAILYGPTTAKKRLSYMQRFMDALASKT